jgi:chaperonin cofactor prefoldin
MEKLTKGLSLVIAVLAISAVGEAWYIVNQKNQIEELNFRITSLQYQSTVLTAWCNKLEYNMSDIQEEFEHQMREMHAEYNGLEIDYIELQRDYSSITYTLEKLQERNDEVQSEFEEYAAHFKQLQNVVNSRLSLDGNLSEFVTPQDPGVVEKMLEATGGFSDPNSFIEFWEDALGLYDWVTANIMYGSDSPYPYLYSDPSYPVRWLEHSARYPNETLFDGTGDCEDQALLLLSMLMAHDDLYTKWCISLKWDGSGHMAVAFPVAGGRLAILDPASEYYSGTGFSFASQPVEEAVERWIGRWHDPTVFVNSIVNDKSFREFESTEEFLEWYSANFGQ